MDTKNWFNDSNFVEADKKIVSEVEGAYALREAWKRIYGKYPSEKSLAILWAKACLETGRFKIGFWNYNFGNIKRKINDNKLFTMFECGEEISLQKAEELQKESPDLIKIIKRYKNSKGNNRASITVLPGHLWSQFLAYKTIEDGAESYIKFVSQNPRYEIAWKKLMDGDPVNYAIELGKAGYYTANPEKYTAKVVKLFNEFIKRKDELMSWNPKETLLPPSEPPILQEDNLISTIPSPPSSYSDNYILEENIPTEKDNHLPIFDDEDYKPIENKETKTNNKQSISLIVIAGTFISFIIMFLQQCQ